MGGRLLVLRVRPIGLAEDLRGRGLVEARPGRGHLQRFQDIDHPRAGDSGRWRRADPMRRRAEDWGGEVINLRPPAGPSPPMRSRRRKDRAISPVSTLTWSSIPSQRSRVQHQLPRRRGSAGDAEHLIALAEQQLAEIAAILAGYAGDECSLGNKDLLPKLSAPRLQ